MILRFTTKTYKKPKVEQHIKRMTLAVFRKTEPAGYNTRSQHITAARAILMATVITIAESAELHPEAPPITEACHAADYLAAISANAVGLLTTAAAEAAAAVDKAAKLNAVAASTNGATSISARLLSATLSARALETLNELNQKQQTIVQGALAASALSGEMETIAELQTTQIGHSGAATTLATQTDGGYLEIKPSVTPNRHGACYKAANERDKADGPTTPKPPDTQTIAVVTLRPALPDKSQPNKPLTMCWSGSSTAAYNGAGCTSAASTAPVIVGGNVFSKHTQKISRKTAKDDDEYKPEGSEGQVPSQATLTRKLKAIADLEKAAAKLTKLTISLDLKTIITSNGIKEKLAQVIDGEKAKYADATKTKVDNLLKEAIGENGEELKNTVGKSLDELTPPKAAVGGAGDKKLSQITSPQEIADAAIYYTVRHFVEEQEQKKKKQARSSCPTNTDKTTEPAKSADECKKHTTERPSKDEKGCDFDEKKPEGERCFPKAETEKKDEKSFSSNLRVSILQVFAAFVALLF
ncbi:variant surface glycoprotein (VSG), putative [Trypanosoma equiperdum]|uniref:Variant surface glycoprotein (VSG), putative n=1 Tax=Trypanosoma equiperdum TaxID=5694 RepID=A0A1G4IJY0_TRYEQ|nr:variant surface glycoprotein (VSG), putative [Trypanosoma equiperdum]